MTLLREDGSPDVELHPVAYNPISTFPDGTTRRYSFVSRRWRYDPVTSQRIVLADGEPAYPYPTGGVTFQGVIVTFNGILVTYGAN